MYLKPIGYSLLAALILMTTPVPSQAQEIDGKQMMETIKHLTDEIGVRPSGSDNASTTAFYISDKLSTTGYHYQIQDYRLSNNRIARNIQAFYPGTSAKEIILIGHYDSPVKSLGAQASACGISLLLESARLVRGQTLPDSVHFAFLGAEEKIPGIGDMYSGSGALADYQKKLGTSQLGGILVLENSGSVNSWIISTTAQTPPELITRVENAALRTRQAIEFRTADENQISSPLATGNLPVIFMKQNLKKPISSAKDTFSQVSRNTLESTAQFILEFIKNKPE